MNLASGLGDEGERFCGAHDADAVIGLEVEKMRVAGDDKVGLGGQRAGKHVIVVGIGEDGRQD